MNQQPATVRPTVPARVATFLDQYQQGPGRIPAEKADATVDLSPAVARMQLIRAPFVHAIIDDFLPAPLFEAMRRDWPAPETHSTVGLPPGAPGDAYIGSRTTKMLEDWAYGRPESAVPGIWPEVSAALRAPRFVGQLFGAFADTIDDNLAECAPDGDGQASFKLYLNRDHGADEALGAHVDALRKLLTIVVYVDLSGPVDERSGQLWGTSLYVDGGGGRVTPVRFSANAAHEPAARVEFVANRAFVMPNTSRALHGVAGGQADVVRRSLMCGYWLLSGA